MDYDYTYELLLGSVLTAQVLWIIVIILGLKIISLWKIFEKANIAGWKSLIPFYNTYLMCKIALGEGWYFLLYLIPVVNAVFSIIVLINLAKSFGKSVGFAMGLIFLNPIFVLILAFGDAKYQGPQKI